MIRTIPREDGRGEGKGGFKEGATDKKMVQSSNNMTEAKSFVCLSEFL